jgi:hypothetical protein
MPRLDLSALTFEHDPEDPDGFRAGMARLGPRLGAEQGIFTGDADDDLIVERASGVDYCRGEA